MGFTANSDIAITHFTTSTPQIKIGKAFEFSLQILSHQKQKLLVDYVMEFATDGWEEKQSKGFQTQAI